MSKATAERARRVQVIGGDLHALAGVEAVLAGDGKWLKLIVARPDTEGVHVLNIPWPDAVTPLSVLRRCVVEQRRRLEAELRGKKRK